ncbi:MAG: hypothetical protein A2087_08005 [Spirochaetes bacterium GWD1_61_31]|nr:MAG: hypothetical protein A2Y37_11535 [Spirochaetes bacterium GWB1_60_80]OHD31639.1 MAG: hypothetical protein A2004_03395 [Spirochaetes bacterium GWC1_61_12]OHD42065.1 MAG: hypothetical protein A2087_08005 [Spirochaetes bacterium GWD1_61_31]OHD43398.1 MAG: hypothetical protein A2Y35_02305 [Spirochaetes bacterium GWE1_60_18]OHD58931.1 MAG: hypothetical protein A2Y32_10750 [Spirochaetes bacterium GWF1_60_12]HAP42985.1 hypothetical protein [Spirochaetaceae bacterium]
MNPNLDIERILADLYAIDPALRAEEEALKKAIGELLANRPGAKLDEGFERELKQRLLERFTQTAGGGIGGTSRLRPRPRWLIRVVGGLGAAAALVVVGLAAGSLVGGPRYGDMASPSVALDQMAFGAAGSAFASEASEASAKSYDEPAAAPTASRGATGGAADALGRIDGGLADAAVVSPERQIIRSAALELEVPAIAAARDRLVVLARGLGGFVSEQNETRDYANITLSVPQAAFDAALEGSSGMGSVLSRSVSAQDVTYQIADYGDRIANRRELLAVYRSYLSNARRLEDILEIENRLNNLTYEIEGLDGQRTSLQRLVAYSTIVVSLRVPYTAAVEYPRDGLGQKLARLFSGLAEAAEDGLIFLVGALLCAVPLALLAMGLWILLFGRIGLLRRAIRRARDTLRNQS